MGPLALLVNNAGVAAGGPVADVAAEQPSPGRCSR